MSELIKNSNISLLSQATWTEELKRTEVFFFFLIVLEAEKSKINGWQIL